MEKHCHPNGNTLYSLAWLDLTKEPMVVATPDTQGRYFFLPMLDMWSDQFACPGKRTTGTSASRFAVVPPGWQGTLPEGVQRIDAPTPHVWIAGRTLANGPKDFEAANQVQRGYTITPLSQLDKIPQPARSEPTMDAKNSPRSLGKWFSEFPPHVAALTADKFFPYAAELQKANPPHFTDQPIVTRMRRLGLEAGKSFDFGKADPAIQRALVRAAPAALKTMQANVPTLARVVNGWQVNTGHMGVYGNDYLKRATVAMVGLFNLPEDTIHPQTMKDADGKPLTGTNDYVLHFDKSEIPPVDAFWSVTMYEAKGSQVASKLNRFNIGGRDALRYNADGSLDIYIQADSPGTEKESNWLPSPANGALC